MDVKWLKKTVMKLRHHISTHLQKQQQKRSILFSCAWYYISNTMTGLLTAGGILSPRVDSNISRLTGSNICFKSPAKEVMTSISCHTHVKHTVVEIWCTVHLIVAETEGAISCLDHLTLISSGLFIGTSRTWWAASITAGVVSWDLPGSPKFIWRCDCYSRWGVEVIIWISIEVSTKSTCFSPFDENSKIKQIHWFYCREDYQSYGTPQKTILSQEKSCTFELCYKSVVVHNYEHF